MYYVILKIVVGIVIVLFFSCLFISCTPIKTTFLDISRKDFCKSRGFQNVTDYDFYHIECDYNTRYRYDCILIISTDKWGEPNRTMDCGMHIIDKLDFGQW